MKIKEVTYIYSYPPRISIHWTNDSITFYSWTNYPSQHNLNDFASLFYPIHYPFYPMNYQFTPPQLTSRGKPQYIEDITYMITAPPSIAIRTSGDLTHYFPWANFPYPQNLENFQPWFPCIRGSKLLKALPQEEKSTKEVFDLFFETDPQEILDGFLDLTENPRRRDQLFSSQSFDPVYPAPEEMSSDEILDHNIRNYQPEPNLPVAHGRNIVRTLERAALRISEYSNSGFLFFKKQQNTAPKENSLPQEKLFS
jgi:hypothetical protein